MILRLKSLFDDSSERIRGKVIGLYGLLIAFNVAAWVWALLALQDYPVLLGTAMLAYSFGLRHAFDADHIAAIDNVTRKLMQDGRRPVGVGLFFSLGHSTVVVALSVAIAATASALQTRFDTFKTVGGIVGTLVSAFFLFAIAAVNLLVLVSVYRTFVSVRNGGRFVEEDLDLVLSNRGLLGRLFRRAFKVVTRSWQMYPLGVLFGLGFDTATEVGLLGISATQASQGLSIWSILVFPALFTAGMTLLDHDRLDPDARRLWLGLRQADPKALLQPDDHGRLGAGGRHRRRPRDAEPHRRPVGLERRRRLLGRDRGAERRFRRARLCDRRAVRLGLGSLVGGVSGEGV